MSSPQQSTIGFSIKMFTTILLLLLLGPIAIGEGRENKFLIVHMDATSSEDFFTELEAGNLPNIASLFQNGQQVRHGLTLYPGGTEIIMPRIKAGLDNSQGEIVGWGYLDRTSEKEFGLVPIFLEMFSGFPRRSRHHFAIGLPTLHHLAGLSLLNIDRVWETQDIAEFYWFHSDVAGHMFGREMHMKSLRTLDYYLGVAARSGRLDGANLVLYSDHGMTTRDVETVKYETIVTEIVQDELRHLAYPNLYIHDQKEKYRLAQELAEETAVDISLVTVSKDLIRGYTAQGYFEVAHENGTYAYSFTDEDYFGYQNLGCVGTFLSKEEWLRQTKDHRYPAVPPNFYNYLSNPGVGDIVAILDSPKIPHALTAMKGNHSGVTSNDLLVPLLLTGPAFEDQEQIEEFWLHELYSVYLPMIDFEAKER
ncbi:MAG TPA: alkaline phosphatase family protein, partial [Limnochordia bacterium]|nr:alkaline phosphatase family protein [Limnochordia bacterium]